MNTKDLAIKLKIDANGNITAFTKDVNSGLEKTASNANKASKSIDGMAGSFSSLKAAAVGALGAITFKELAQGVIETTAKFQSLKASLVTVTGSASNADAAFKKIQEFTSSTPYQLDQVTNAFIKMKALGLDDSEQSMRSYGDTASSMGKSLNDMIEAVADAATGEFERLKEFGIKASSEGDRVKFTFKGVTTEIGKNSQEIQDYLIQLGELNFSGGMERQMETLDGRLSNLSDSWDQALYAIGNESLPAIETAISALNSLTNGVKGGAENIDDLAKVVGVGLTAALTAKAIPAIWQTSKSLNVATLSAAGFATSMRAATAASLAFAKTPLGIFFTTAAAGAAYLSLQENELDTATQDLTQSFADLNVEMSEFEVGKKAEELARYRAEIEKIKTQQSQGMAVDVLGVREAGLQAKIDNLMQGRDSDYDAGFESVIKQFSELDAEDAKWRSQQEVRAEQFAKREFDRAERQLELLDAQYEREQVLLDASAERAIDAIERENAAIMERSALLADNYQQSVENAQLQKDMAQFSAWESADAALEQINFKLQTVGMTSREVAIEEAKRIAIQDNWDSSDLDEYLAKLAQLDTAQASLSLQGMEDGGISKQIDDFTASIDDMGDAWTRMGDAQAQSLANMSKAFGDYAKHQKKSAQDQDKLDDLRFDNLVDYEQGLISLSEFQKNENKLTAEQAKVDEQNQQNTLNFYQGLAGEIANTFQEGSKEAQAFQLVQQGLAVYDGIRAIMNAWAAPFPANIPMVALTTANVAALLSQMGTSLGGGSGSAPTMPEFDSAYVQENQGTGTVFGDPLAKSESIDNSLEILNDYNAKQYAELRSIDTGVKQMVSSLDAVISSIVTAGYGRFDASAFNIFEGITSGGFGSSVPLIGGALSSVFGGKTETRLTDSGIDLAATTLGDVMMNEFIDGVTYAVQRFDKDGGWFGSDKTWYETTRNALDNSVESAFGQVFSHIGETVIDLGDSLGLDLVGRVSDYAFDLEKISLKDLSAEEQLAEINAVVSAQTDMIVDEMLGAITNSYQKLGEGDLETAIRLVTEKAITESIIGLTDIEFGGDVLALSQSLGVLAGGIDALSESAEMYFEAFYNENEQFYRLQDDLNESFGLLNKSLPTTRDAFRDLVSSLDLTTSSGQEAYTTLLDLSDEASEYYGFIENLSSDRLSDLEGLYGALDDTYNTLIGTVSDNTAQSYMSAQSTISDALNQARAGDYLSMTDELASALSVLSNNKESNYASLADFQRDQIATAAMVEELAYYTQDQINYEESMVETLDDSLTVLKDIRDALDMTYTVNMMTTEMDGSHATGLDYVPFDGYRAELHKGEAVIDASSMQLMRQYGIKTGQQKDVSPLLERLIQRVETMEQSMRQGHIAIATNTLDAAEFLEKWDASGMPEVRA